MSGRVHLKRQEPRLYIIFLRLDCFYCLTNRMFLQIVHNARDLCNLNLVSIVATLTCSSPGSPLA